MAFTMQEGCDRARIPLQDDSKVRYSDTVLLGYLNAGIQLLINKRPDLYFGSFSSLPGQLALGATFPLDDGYLQPVADYASARVRCRSAEEVRTAQTQLLMVLADDASTK